MSSLMFASSPSWYCTGAIDTDDRGFLYFGANYNLYVLNIGISPPKYLLHLYAHQQRAVGVSVCKHAGVWLCSTIGEDGKVKIWDLDAKICLQEHVVHKTALTCVHWSPVDKNLIVSADNKGGIVIWRTNTSEFKHICPESGHIFAVKCSPHTENIIAVGYKSSTILILDIQKYGQVRQRLRGHDEEIQGLCWCPVPGEQLEKLDTPQEKGLTDEFRGRSLLASSSKDRTIRVWAMSTGRVITTLRLQSGGKKDKVDDRVGGRIWVALHWPSKRPTELVSSSFNGEVILWDLLKAERRSFSASKYSRGHNRLVFNATVGGQNGEVLCTSSMDRHIVLWDMNTLKAQCNIPTLGGFGYCVTSSPVNPGRLAVGSGDHLIRIWNTDNQVNPFDTQTYWQGLKSKVTALKWHPVKESQLAYGTEDGRVGIYEVFSSRPPQISSTYHRGTVYTVCWGPPCVDHVTSTQNAYFLYSCGDGRVLQHEPEQLDKEAKLVNKCIREVNGIEGKTPNPSEICFKPDYKVFAVGNDDGSVDILSVPDLIRLCSVQSHRKLVNVVSWHPEYTAESRQPSKYRNWLASGSGEYQVHVIDLTQVIENKSDKAVVLTEPTCQLVGHTNRITQLSWSPFKENKLASASYDHTVQIWDISTCEPLANYRGHYGRLMCVEWSDLDPDVVYSGGQDNTVQCWKISEQEFTHPPVCVIERKKKNKKKFLKDDTSGESRTESQDGVASSVNSELQALLEEKRRELSQNKDAAIVDNQEFEQQNKARDEVEQLTGSQHFQAMDYVTEVQLSVADILGDNLAPGESSSIQLEDPGSQPPDVTVVRRDGKERKKKRVKSLFPTSSLRDNRGKGFQHEDCAVLANILYKGKKGSALGEDWYHIGHFIDRKSTFELVRYEENHHKKNDNQEQLMLLELFRGNVSSVLEKAATEGQLSDWLVGLSGAGSTGLWKDTVLKYADQLGKGGFIHKAASFLLVARKIHEAIDLLVRHGAFKDALCLARLRLSPSDPKLKSIYLEWANLMFKDANLEMAAKCYLAVLDPLQAAVCLSRRSDLSALRTAAKICLVANEIEAARLYTRRLVQDCYVACDWLTAQEVVNSHSHFMHYGMPLGCHELLVTQLSEMKLLSPDVLQTARLSEESGKSEQTLKIPKFLVDTSDISLCPWPSKLVVGEAFCNALVRKWVQSYGLPLETEKLCDVYKILWESKAERHGAVQLKQILADISLDISLGVLQLLLGDGDQAAEHWGVAIAVCIEQQEQDVAEGLCRLLLPQGINKYEKQAQEVHALFVTSSKTMATTTRKTSLTLCKNPFLLDHSGDGDKLPTIHCDLQEFTPLACLRAYYCLCVLSYWRKDIFSTEDNSKSPKMSQLSGSSESLSSQGSKKSNRSPRFSPVSPKPGTTNKKNLVGKDLTSEFSQGTLNVEGIKLPMIDNKVMNLSMQELVQVAQCLIWDVQVEKQKVQESLIQIRNSVARMIAGHKEVQPSNSESNHSSSKISKEAFTESKNKFTTASNSLRRHPSGEYLPMSKSGQNAKSKRKPHEDILLIPDQEVMSEAVPMLSMIKGTTVVEEEDIREVDADMDDPDRNVNNVDEDRDTAENEANSLNSSSNVIKQDYHGKNDTDDVDIDKEKKVYSSSIGEVCKANKTDQEKRLQRVIKRDDCNETCGKDSGDLKKHGDKDENSELNKAYNNLPDDWFELPIDTKYSADCVTVHLLTCEQDRLEEQMLQFSPQIQRLPFPSVFASVFSLYHVVSAQSGSEYRSVGEALRQWTERHHYHTDHLQLLDMLGTLQNQSSELCG